MLHSNSFLSESHCDSPIVIISLTLTANNAASSQRVTTGKKITSLNSGKKFTPAIAMMASVMSVTACSGNYVIYTNDGHMITAQVKPARDKETGMISYKDSDANMHQLQQRDVKNLCKSKPP